MGLYKTIIRWSLKRRIVMIIKGTRTENNVSIDIEPKEIVKALYNYFKFDYQDFVKDDKVCFDTKARYHNTWFETHIKSEDPERVKVLKTLEKIKKLLDVKDYQMRY
jgi:hypothetical protein